MWGVADKGNTEGNYKAERYRERNLELIDWQVLGGASPPQLSIKLSALTPSADPIDVEGARERRIGVRLVKGAYRDTEMALARQRRWPQPVFEEKSPTDAQFELLTGIEPHHRLAREEIFGPVLGVLRVRSFEQAVDMALDSDYGLTGSVFSRLPEHIELTRGRFRVGNLYINRLSRRNASVAATLDVVRRALPREAAEGAAPAGSGNTNAQAKGLTNASNEAFLAGERPVLRGPTEGASGPPNMGRQSLR